MGSEIRGLSEPAPLIRREAAEPSVGEYLARQRRLRRISLDELAYRTKIPRRSLERLEAGAFDARPDGFARVFVRSVASALGLDPEEAVMRLLDEPVAERGQSGRIGQYGGLALRWAPWLLASILLAAGLVFGLISLLGTGLGESEPGTGVLIRRDVVRDLAARTGRSTFPGRRPPEPADSP